MKRQTDAKRGSKVPLVIAVLVVLCVCCLCFPLKIRIGSGSDRNWDLQSGDTYTVYARYDFGSDGDDFGTALEAAESARERHGDRNAKVVCDDKVIVRLGQLAEIITDLKQDLVCPSGGYLAILPE